MSSRTACSPAGLLSRPLVGPSRRPSGRTRAPSSKRSSTRSTAAMAESGRLVVEHAADALQLASAPHLLRRLHDQAELGELLLFGERVAFHRGGEAALRRQAQLVEVDVLRCLVDAPLELV